MREHRRPLRQTGSLHRRCSLGLLSFAQLEMCYHVVRILDTSSCGVEIESDVQMEPGLVWFHGGLEDHQGGILLWSRKQGEHHRAGIRFLSLSAEEERHLRYWPPCPGQLRPCSDLEDALSLWMRAARREDHRSAPVISEAPGRPREHEDGGHGVRRGPFPVPSGHQGAADRVSRYGRP